MNSNNKNMLVLYYKTKCLCDQTRVFKSVKTSKK